MHRYFIRRKKSPWQEVTLKEFINALKDLGHPIFYNEKGILATRGFGSFFITGRMVTNTRESQKIYKKTCPEFAKFIGRKKGI